VRLREEDIHRIARAVVALLREEGIEATGTARSLRVHDRGRDTAGGAVGALLTARQVADLLGVRPGWVRERGADLALRLGDGERPRLRWTAEAVEALTSRRSGVASSSPPPSGLEPEADAAAVQGTGNVLDNSPPRELLPLPQRQVGPRDVVASGGPATRRRPRRDSQPNPEPGQAADRRRGPSRRRDQQEGAGGR